MNEFGWRRVDPVDVPAEGRVRSVVVDGQSVALTRCGGRFGALENRCPHQGGPVGEGSIENGWLRCPWHGYDYDPVSGKPPEGFTDAVTAYDVEERADGVYVKVPEPPAQVRTVADVLVETLVAHGVTHVFGMVGHSNLGFAEAMRRAEERGELTYIGIRHEGAASFAASAFGKLTGRPAACFAIAGPGSTNLLTGLYDAKLDGSPVIAISGQVPSSVRGRGAFQDVDLSAVFADVAVSTTTVQAGSDHAELAALAVKHAVDGRGVAHLVLPDEVQVQPSEAPAAPAGGRSGPPGLRPDAAALATAALMVRDARRPVVIAGHGAAPWRGGRADRTRRTARRAGAHHVQGERPGAGHPSARRRRARPQRYAGRELADERVGPAARRRRLVLEPHRHRVVQADRADRRPAGRARPLPPGQHRGAGRRGDDARAAGPGGRGGEGRGPAGRRGGALGAVAGGEGAPGRGRPWSRRLRGGGVRRAVTPAARGRRGDR